jgi:hypothetical protein
MATTYDPPVSHEPRMQQLSDDFARQGLSPFHVRSSLIFAGRVYRARK